MYVRFLFGRNVFFFAWWRLLYEIVVGHIKNNVYIYMIRFLNFNVYMTPAYDPKQRFLFISGVIIIRSNIRTNIPSTISIEHFNRAFQSNLSIEHFNRAFQSAISIEPYNRAFQSKISIEHFNRTIQSNISIEHFNRTFQSKLSIEHFN